MIGLKKHILQSFNPIPLYILRFRTKGERQGCQICTHWHPVEGKRVKEMCFVTALSQCCFTGHHSWRPAMSRSIRGERKMRCRTMSSMDTMDFLVRVLSNMWRWEQEQDKGVSKREKLWRVWRAGWRGGGVCAGINFIWPVRHLIRNLLVWDNLAGWVVIRDATPILWRFLGGLCMESIIVGENCFVVDPWFWSILVWGGLLDTRSRLVLWTFYTGSKHPSSNNLRCNSGGLSI